MHEQKFKDLLSSTCQVSPERIVLDLESEVMRDPDSIPTFFTGIFCFHIVKPLLPILALLPFLCISKLMLHRSTNNFLYNTGSDWCCYLHLFIGGFSSDFSIRFPLEVCHRTITTLNEVELGQNLILTQNGHIYPPTESSSPTKLATFNLNIAEWC